MKEKRTLCELEKAGMIRLELEEYKELVKKGKFVCRRCGRVARRKKNLCRPAKL